MQPHRPVSALLSIAALLTATVYAQNPSATLSSSNGKATIIPPWIETTPMRVHAIGDVPGPLPANPNRSPFISTVVVNASPNKQSSETPSVFQATAADIISSAGTYGDFSRYLQLFPGVLFNSDQSDDIIVRGGNPIENLYLVDGISVPNINHISTQASTGGLVSMIDTAAIQNVELSTGGYDAKYEERLSSVVNIHTRQDNVTKRHTEADAGIVGVGGLSESPLPGEGSLLISAHRGILNLFTNNIGLDGVPIYTNSLARARFMLSPSNEITLLSLAGVDSINVTPSAGDILETNTIQTQYSGWRTTNGFRWQHIYSPRTFGVLTLSDSEQHEALSQEDQLLNGSFPPGTNDRYSNLTNVYFERTHDGATTLKYDHSLEIGPVSLTAGAMGRLSRIDYRVIQPVGQQSPLNVDPLRSDAISFSPAFTTGETGTYAELKWNITKPLNISAGGRLQTFALGGYRTLTPRLGMAYQITSHTSLHLNFGEYAQLAPAIYILSYPGNRSLTPIHARHLIAGMDIWSSNRVKISLEGYQKIYNHYPVSTEYPSLSLANLIDTLGQQFVWLPMTSQGRGKAEGIELFAQSHMGAHLFGQFSFAYARAKFSGLDHVMRPGNFDYPIVVNAAGRYDSGKHYEASFRYEFSSGRPYTPFLIADSLAQNRGIYDTSEINAVRGPLYSRLDFQLARIFWMHGTQLQVYAGVDNVLDRQNFLANEWLPRCKHYGCPQIYGPYLAIYQTPIFPNFGIHYLF